MRLEKGDVFWWDGPHTPNNPHPHFVIARNGDRVVIVHGSSKRDATLSRCEIQGDAEKCFVVALPDECGALSKATYINCHQAHEGTESEITGSLKFRSVEDKRASPALLRRIAEGILASGALAANLKRKIDPNYQGD